MVDWSFLTSTEVQGLDRCRVLLFLEGSNNGSGPRQTPLRYIPSSSYPGASLDHGSRSTCIGAAWRYVPFALQLPCVFARIGSVDKSYARTTAESERELKCARTPSSEEVEGFPIMSSRQERSLPSPSFRPAQQTPRFKHIFSLRDGWLPLARMMQPFACSNPSSPCTLLVVWATYVGLLHVLVHSFSSSESSTAAGVIGVTDHNLTLLPQTRLWPQDIDTDHNI